MKNESCGILIHESQFASMSAIPFLPCDKHRYPAAYRSHFNPIPISRFAIVALRLCSGVTSRRIDSRARISACFYTIERRGYVVPFNTITINCPIAGLSRLNTYFKRLIAFAVCLTLEYWASSNCPIQTIRGSECYRILRDPEAVLVSEMGSCCSSYTSGRALEQSSSLKIEAIQLHD